MFGWSIMGGGSNWGICHENHFDAIGRLAGDRLAGVHDARWLHFIDCHWEYRGRNSKGTDPRRMVPRGQICLSQASQQRLQFPTVIHDAADHS